MHDSQQIAATIKELAKSKKITVGKMLADCGMSKNALSSMQSGGYLPRIESIVRIADYLGCSVDYLLGRETAAAQSAANTAGSAAILQRNDEKLNCLLHCWDDMNDEGHEKVCDYAEDLCQNLKYKKLSSPDLGAEVGQLVG